MEESKKNPSLEDVVDEYYGVEHETEFDDDSDSNLNTEKPFDAEKIRIDQQMLSVRYIYELIADEALKLNPDFQRYGVWTEKKRKSLLIESLILRIPVPAFYFYETKDGKFIVIDGQQRLTTIKEFIEGKFKLTGLEYLSETCDGKKFDQLDPKYKQRINRTQLAVNILDARAPSKVIFEIFRRVNTGGVSLRPQEIRNAIAENRVRIFLKEMKNSEEFKLATRGRIKDERMDAQEIVLRFIAFFHSYDFTNHLIKYESNSISSMLDEELDKMNNFTENEFIYIKKVFKQAMKNAYELFGDYCFNKIYLDNDNVYRTMDIVNKALFTSISIILADEKYENCTFLPYRKKACVLLAQYLDDQKYFKALTVGTGDKKAIECSFYYAKKIIEESMRND